MPYIVFVAPPSVEKLRQTRVKLGMSTKVRFFAMKCWLPRKNLIINFNFNLKFNLLLFNLAIAFNFAWKEMNIIWLRRDTNLIQTLK